MKKIFLFLGNIILCEGVGIAATPFTLAAIPTWYAHLHKAFFSPPNWVFGPVWTLLYFLMGVALFILLQNKKKKQSKRALIFFAIQLFCNFLWSFLFFGLHSPLLGLIDIVLLEIFIVLTMKNMLKISKNGFLLFLPYLLWVSFATLLNTAIVILN